MRVTDGQSETEYRMADVVDGGVAWSPDGSVLGVMVQGTLSLIPVASKWPYFRPASQDRVLAWRLLRR